MKIQVGDLLAIKDPADKRMRLLGRVTEINEGRGSLGYRVRMSYDDSTWLVSGDQIARVVESEWVHLLKIGGRSWCGDYNVTATVRPEKATCPDCLAESKAAEVAAR